MLRLVEPRLIRRAPTSPGEHTHHSYSIGSPGLVLSITTPDQH